MEDEEKVEEKVPIREIDPDKPVIPKGLGNHPWPGMEKYRDEDWR